MASLVKFFVERTEPDEWVLACRSIVVESVTGRGRRRPRKKWRQCDDEDMAKLNLSVTGRHDRVVWRNGILRNRLTRDVARKNDVKQS